ncbi:SusC/RagA family TonB-linked outer membrane protein [Chondrinema litorale]|uniref:SusC/RagA family TonB-linked outer membrane protein n=1 Tax=Chondrinema litorale TaxID=2994555 RepID=UPI00254307D5|nr:TonB-dependent receptor [Chondrinema litorale]UZR99939.1 TonB-dependent receptor [Chondrinema litorale]
MNDCYSKSIAAAILLFFSAISMAIAQDKRITGKIVAASDGLGIPGASILVKGTTTGTSTDVNGNFDLILPPNAEMLVISYIGYVSKELSIGNQTNFDISLDEDVQQLEEVMVVGYGTQERAKVIGAISSVKSEEITSVPVISPDQALQGRAAGVTVVNNGAPGQGATVRIRGVGTPNDNSPLYVIDGMPSGDLNQINPNDIESMEVLKDASAAAIYGSRAANGVILITTKKGTRGKTRVSIDSYAGVQKVWKTLDLLNTEQYIDYASEIQTNAGLSVPSRFTDTQWSSLLNNNTDWQDQIFQTGVIQSYNANVSGGGENSMYNISGGYFDQEGTMLNTGFERYSIRANSEFNVGKKFKVGQTLSIAYSETQSEPYNGGRSQIEHTIKSAPYLPVYYSDYVAITGLEQSNLGGFKGPDQVDDNDAENPVSVAMLNDQHTDATKILGTVYGELEIIEGLKYKLLLGIDMTYADYYTFRPAYDNGDFHNVDFAAITQNRRNYISPLITNSLTYDRTFADKHNLNVLGVIEKQTSVSTNTNTSSQNSISNVIEQLTTEALSATSGRSEWALISYLGRVNYDYDGKYLLSASVRRDGSARFGPENKWGTFPSVSVGWRISQEPFLQSVDFITDLKLRGSWGQAGNQNIGNYGYQATINSNYAYSFQDGVLASASTVTELANPALKWETTEMLNIGLDMSVLDGKVSMALEYFDNETQDVLVQVPLAASLGLSGSPYVNAGTVSNKGFEVTLGYRDAEGEFQWSVDANLSHVKNEVVSLGGGNPINSFNFEGDNITQTIEGQPIAYFFGWQTDGIFQSDDEVAAHATQDNAAPGDIRFKDLAGAPDENGNLTAPDGVIDANDKVNLGNPFPDFTYGLNATANYKGFDFTLFIQGVSGNDIYNTNIYDLEGMTRVFNAGTSVLNRWTGAGTSNTIPRGVTGDPNRNARASNRYVEDGSFLRMRNIALGYTLPSSLLENIGSGFISNVRVYVSSQNLFTITNYSGYDPEIGGFRGENTTLQLGVDRGNYPQPRTFLGGVQISF